ncbi:uncharacterized protein LOC124209940 isoform X1 [Daphnia pulex]|uniref:uncharacterized protein LOC124209940 isoform X1 n=1 Tax=Daphnia pulex TaxID=6669 RepID=UPI001EDE2783|nr:uncharacterized protein LOC124209940 isoform X1 [Daphnia pulex]
MQVPPPGFNYQQSTQKNLVLHQQQTETSTRHVSQQGWHQTNNGLSSIYSSWSNQSAVSYAAASTCPPACVPDHVMTNARHILGMETTIDYLKELLSKEFDMNVKERTAVKILKKDVENARHINKCLIEQLQKAQAEKTEVNSALQYVLAVQNELSVNQKEIVDAKSELVTAQNSISDLKAANAFLESKLAELQLQDEEKGPDTSSETMKTASIPRECSEKSLLEEKQTDYETLKSQYDLLKVELDSTVQMKNIVTCMFKELSKKHLYMIEYSGEQMYIDYEEKHAKFKGQLNSLKKDSTYEKQCSLIEQTLGCLEQQLKLLEDFREDFRIRIELLMCRIDQEFALVSDLSIRARKPSFEIPVDDFDGLLQMIAKIGGLELDEKLNLKKIDPHSE